MSLDDYKLPDGRIDATIIPGPKGNHPPPFMTLRDEFAVAAMQGIISRGGTLLESLNVHVEKATVVQNLTELSYEFADAMLAERAK